MFNKIIVTLFAFGGLLFPTLTRASDWVQPGGGTFAQVADGGGARTTITLVNLDGVPAPYILNFFDESGNPMTLSTTSGQANSLTGTLPVNGSTIIQTSGAGTTQLVGYGVLVTQNTIAGSLVFGLQLGVFTEASCPLDTGQDNFFGLPFDQTTSTEGIAIANGHGNGPVTVTVTFYDQTGTKIPTATTTILLGGTNPQHQSFLLPTRFPEANGKKGFVVFQGSSNFNLLGLRATNTTLTSVTPIVPLGF